MNLTYTTKEAFIAQHKSNPWALVCAASDPDAPWWALWEVVFRARWFVERPLSLQLAQRVLYNPALPVLLLEEPLWVGSLKKKCERLIEEES